MEHPNAATVRTTYDSPYPTRVACAQCGYEPGDDRELRSWRHGALLLDSELGDDAAGLLLCPDCTAEHHTHDYDEGVGA